MLNWCCAWWRKTCHKKTPAFLLNWTQVHWRVIFFIKWLFSLWASRSRERAVTTCTVVKRLWSWLCGSLLVIGLVGHLQSTLSRVQGSIAEVVFEVAGLYYVELCRRLSAQTLIGPIFLGYVPFHSTSRVKNLLLIWSSRWRYRSIHRHSKQKILRNLDCALLDCLLLTKRYTLQSYQQTIL